MRAEHLPATTGLRIGFRGIELCSKLAKPAASMADMPGVDKFWQELNRKAVPKNKSSVASETIRYQMEHKSPPRKGPDQSDPQNLTPVPPHTSNDLSSECSQLGSTEVESRLQRDLQGLKAPTAATRCQALRNIWARVWNCSASPYTTMQGT